MSVKLLMHNLVASYGPRMKKGETFEALLQKILKDDFTETDAWELTKRLVKNCKFTPTIAEIAEQYEPIKAAKYREKEAAAKLKKQAEEDKHKLTPEENAACALRAQLHMERIKQGWRPPKTITPLLRAFAQHWIPDISDETIEEHYVTIKSAYDGNRMMELENEPTRMRLNWHMNAVYSAVYYLPKKKKRVNAFSASGERDN